MGWASGSSLMSELIDIVKNEVKDELARERIYERMITAFQDEDCDTLDECVGEDPAFDLVFESLNVNSDPEYDEYDDFDDDYDYDDEEIDDDDDA